MPCSFCNSPIHNISNCNHQLIHIYYENIKQTYLSVIALNNSVIYNQNLFKMILNSRFYVRDLRAIGVRYLNLYARTSKHILISLLWQYFDSRIWQQDQQIQENVNVSQENNNIENFDNDPYPEDAGILNYINNLVGIPSILPYQPTVNVGFGHNLSYDLELEGNGQNFIKKYRIRLNYLIEENDKSKSFEDCVICYDNVSCMDLVKLSCNHEFCSSCIKNTLKYHNNIHNNPSCALCRKTMLCFTVKNIETYDSIAEHCIL